MKSPAIASIVFVLTAGFVVPFGCGKKPSGPDQTTPKGAALIFAGALEKGDVTTARNASNASGIEADLVEAMAKSAVAMKHLADVATAKFGADGKKLLQPQAITVTGNLADAEVDQQGADRATVRSRDGRDKLQLERTDGLWRVDIGALTKGKDLSNVVPFFRAAATAAKEVAAEIDAGRCKSAEDARKEMASRTMAKVPEMARQQYEASTRPLSPLDTP